MKLPLELTGFVLVNEDGDLMMRDEDSPFVCVNRKQAKKANELRGGDWKIKPVVVTIVTRQKTTAE